MTAFRAGSCTDVGRLRRENQDLPYVADALFAVADGMGGHHGGEIAARLAVERLVASFEEPSVEALVRSVQSANASVIERAGEDPGLRGMGTTLAALAPVTTEGGEERLAVVNVGDSRVYVLLGDRLRQITKDHSLVALLVDQGTITAAEAVHHPQRNILTRALGIEEKVMVDSFELAPVTGDRYLLCSDGLFNELEEREIVDLLRGTPDPSEAAERLVEAANDAGGRDNVTCVVVDVLEGRADPPEGLGDDRVLAVTSGQHRAVMDAETEVRGARPVLLPPPPPPDGDGAADHHPVVEAPAPPDAGEPATQARGSDASDPVTGAGDATMQMPTVVHGGEAEEHEIAHRAGTRTIDDLPTVPRRRITWRAGLFAAAVLAALLVAVLAVGFAARNTFYVGFEDDEIAIYRGRPGGVLWIEPSVVERTGVFRDEVPRQFVAELDAGKDEGSLESAREYVRFLRERATPAEDPIEPDDAVGDPVDEDVGRDRRGVTTTTVDEDL